MGRAESVVHKHIRQGSQVLAEGFAVLCLFRAVAGVLKQHYFAVLHGFHGRLRIGTYHLRVCGEFHFLAQKLCQTGRHRR